MCVTFTLTAFQCSEQRYRADISRHEVRTPLNAILNLSRLLLDRLDGPLTALA